MTNKVNDRVYLYRSGGNKTYSLLVLWLNKPIYICKPSVLFCGTLANSAEPDQMPQNMASDQVLPCLLTECTFEFE